jgi:hypothetical protein
MRDLLEWKKAYLKSILFVASQKNGNVAYMIWSNKVFLAI